MRKKSVVAMLFVFLIMITFGCSGSVDEKKPLSEVKTEAQSMSVKGLQSIIDKYKAAIESKKGEIDVLKDKIKEIPLTQLLGEEAKMLKKEAGELKSSLRALKDRMKIYLEELKKQGAAAR